MRATQWLNEIAMSTMSPSKIPPPGVQSGLSLPPGLGAFTFQALVIITGLDDARVLQSTTQKGIRRKNCSDDATESHFHSEGAIDKIAADAQYEAQHDQGTIPVRPDVNNASRNPHNQNPSEPLHLPEFQAASEESSTFMGEYSLDTSCKSSLDLEDEDLWAPGGLDARDPSIKAARI
eukprot:CAMPEP_0206470514 /NCGR_PEP_ID=MMETSP0324_2-20121206/30980_1 /ASSEMBLY_ACC=CAM_ASM_000836 /TAXON_ID=2866 /ORGANISM="Crypthecodinium cohnii, Strain Seligo" /LENGTH=177 /DNA_ID=CAMNT_0053944597 /DNA_START=300 /DNA_END=834 /DNA_ORIENTATION=-